MPTQVILSAYRFRLYPNDEQKYQLARQFGCGRWVYNHFLARRQAHYEQTGKSLSYTAMCAELTVLKQAEATAWLAEVHSQPLQQKLKDLTDAYTRFFAKISGYP